MRTLNTPYLKENQRHAGWLNHPSKKVLYRDWCMCTATEEWGNPRLVVFYHQNQEPVDGRIKVFDLWLPAL